MTNASIISAVGSSALVNKSFIFMVLFYMPCEHHRYIEGLLLSMQLLAKDHIEHSKGDKNEC